MDVNQQKLRELIAKATPGPWKSYGELVYFPENRGGFSVADCPQPDGNAALIAAARNALPALLDELERKDAEIAEAKGQIEWLDRQNNRLREALDSIRQFGSDTLSGRTDGPDDREWQRGAVLEMTKRARAALATPTLQR